jgi:peptidoglycan/xylan/chitin deacetylase (PgdA/CDA1 family)
MNCENELPVTVVHRPIPDSEIELNKEYIPDCSIATWFDNKRAAYSITFDDAKPSHFYYAFPELTKRNFRATFFIHISGVEDWERWRAMSRQGHEITSHTRTHPKLTELPLEKVEKELYLSKLDIIKHLGIQEDVATFSYPYNLHNQDIVDLVKKHYLAARGTWGLNSNSLTENERYLLKAVSIGPNYTLDEIRRDIHYTIHSRGWMILYQHSLNIRNKFVDYEIPYKHFQTHLNDLETFQDSLWIDTMGNVAKYMWLRENMEIRLTAKNTDLFIASGPGLERFHNVPVTVMVNLPPSWKNKHIYCILDSHYYIPQIHNNKIKVNLLPESKIKLIALQNRMAT